MGLAWKLSEAVTLCREIERICPEFGCHVALTGGVLYKDGARKDLDLLFYRIRQVEKIDVDGLFSALASLGIERTNGSGSGWVIKATWRSRADIDCFFPEVPSGSYPTQVSTATSQVEGLEDFI